MLDATVALQGLLREFKAVLADNSYGQFRIMRIKCPPGEITATINGADLGPWRCMMGAGDAIIGDTKYFFTLLADDQLIGEKFLELARRTGAEVCESGVLQQLNVKWFTGPAALWVLTLYYFQDDQTRNELLEPIVRSILALNEILKQSKEQKSEMFPADHFEAKYGIKPNTLYKARFDRRLKGEKRGGRWFYKLDDVQSCFPDVFAEDDGK